MLLEDDLTMLGLLKTLLEIEGYQVVQFEVPNQETFLFDLLEEKPDYLVMDVNLRRVNGLDIVRALRLNKAFQTLRVIMTSGMNIGDSCIKSGADTFILKPFMPEELIDSLK